MRVAEELAQLARQTAYNFALLDSAVVKFEMDVKHNLLMMGHCVEHALHLLATELAATDDVVYQFGHLVIVGDGARYLKRWRVVPVRWCFCFRLLCRWYQRHFADTRRNLLPVGKDADLTALFFSHRSIYEYPCFCGQ